MGAKWRERRVRYEQQKTDAKMDSIDLEPATPTPVADSDDARGKVENKYEDIVHSSSGVLLLPSVPPLSEEQLIAKVLTSVEQQSIIQEAQNDRLPRLSRENKEGKERTGMQLTETNEGGERFLEK